MISQVHHPTLLSAAAMQNPVYLLRVGASLLRWRAERHHRADHGLPGTVGRNVHPSNGFAGGRRATSRWAALIYGANGGNATDPQLSRANDLAGGTPSPAFDYGNTYATSATGTVATVGGVSVVTFGGGITAHARPFVDGQWVTCASCTAQVITSVSVPPTQSTASGAGEVGQSFTITLSGALGVTGSNTITAGCHSVSGSGGSNCINVDASINVGGTFGIAAALDTCGANNLNGNAPNYVVPNGVCQGNGVGSLTRAFRIGTNQLTYGNATTSMTPDRSLTIVSILPMELSTKARPSRCNIVAATVVQCVKGPAYSSGMFSSVGKWTSGLTFISYGDTTIVSGRNASLLGYVGGQSFPFTAGSGYTNGTTQPTVTCTTIQSGGTVPKFDVTVSGGAIVNVVPSAVASGTVPAGLGIGSTCTIALPAGGTGGAIPTIPVAPLEGVGGIGTFNTDSNTMGLFLYDNSGEPGNPLSVLHQRPGRLFRAWLAFAPLWRVPGRGGKRLSQFRS